MVFCESTDYESYFSNIFRAMCTCARKSVAQSGVTVSESSDNTWHYQGRSTLKMPELCEMKNTQSQSQVLLTSTVKRLRKKPCEKECRTVCGVTVAESIVEATLTWSCQYSSVM